MRASHKLPQNALVLGIDLGTSGVKCVVVSGRQIIGSATAPLTVRSPRPGWSEQSPSDWISATIRAVGEALTDAGHSGELICGIGLSGQMHGAVTLDKDNTPIRPAILWNDNRSTADCVSLSKALPEIGHIAGIGPLPGFTAPKLMWMAREEPVAFAQINQILLPKDYLGLWLTGERATDRSDAAGTMWLDQKTRAWSPAVIAATGIAEEWLPPLKDGFEPVGKLRKSVAQALSLRAGIPVVAGGGDAATGALSLGAATPGKCFISLGTSGQLLVVDAEYSPAPEKFVHAYCHTLPDTWFRMAAMLNGARPLAWFASVLGCDMSEMLAAAQTCDQSRIPLFLPYLTGERSPHGDPDIRGAFYGLQDATTSAEMARAVVESVAFSMGDARMSFGPHFAPYGPIPIIGGGSRSDLVLRSLADVLGTPVARSDAGDGGAALGAALLAQVETGASALNDLAFDPTISMVFEPQRNTALLERFERYQTLYKALKTAF